MINVNKINKKERSFTYHSEWNCGLEEEKEEVGRGGRERFDLLFSYT